MPDFDPIVPSSPVPPVTKDEPTGRFRRPVMPPPDTEDDEDNEPKPAAEQPKRPADDGHIDEYA